jgi:hypothetical protein
MKVRRRFILETVLAACSGVLGLVTLVWRSWIETLFGVDPDHGNGTVEWLIIFGLLTVALALSLTARAERRHASLTHISGE